MRTLLLTLAFGIIFESLSLAQPSLRKKRMIDGEISPIEDFPYVVALGSNWNSCTGIIISPYHILTAAHCVRRDNSSYRACVGAQVWCDKGSRINVTRYIRHQDYHATSDDNSENDVAVLLLEKPIEFDDKKQSIAMFEAGEESKPGSIGVAAGWGIWDSYPNGSYSDLIRSVKLEIIDTEKCIEAYKEMDSIQPGEICAVSTAEKPNQSACNGDSGGPLVIDGRVAGIAAHVENCKTSPYPNVYTEVAYFRKWIDQAIEELSVPIEGVDVQPSQDSIPSVVVV